MDPLSVCASVLALITVTTKTVKLLNEYSMTAKGAPAEVHTLIEELKLLNGILSDIEKNYTSKAADGKGPEENSATLLSTIEACQKYLLETMKLLEDCGMGKPAEPGKDGEAAKKQGSTYKTLFKRMKYPLKREDIQKSLMVVRDYKASLSLALSVEDRKSTNVIHTMLSRLEAASLRSEETMHNLRDQNSQLLRTLISGMSNMRPPPSYSATVAQIKKHFEVPQRPTATFVGREDILQQIQDHFTRGDDDDAEQRRCALYGLGGSGKTQIALTYAFKRQTAYDNVFFINAASTDSITSAFVKIHQLLQLTSTQEATEKIELVKRYFSSPENPNWLIIFDNADDLLEVDLPAYFPLSSGGDIIITTRDAQVEDPDITTHAIHLEVLPPAEAKALLLKRSGIKTPLSAQDDAAALDIVTELGCLPLALDQAGAYMQARRTSLQNYRALYEKQTQALLGYRSKLSKYQNTVHTTWELSFQKLEADDADTAYLFLLLCQFDNAGIPDSLLKRGAVPQLSYGRNGEEVQVPPENSGVPSALIALLGDEFKFAEAVERLLSFSLVQRTVDGTGFVLHKLVQWCGSTRVDEGKKKGAFEDAVKVASHAFPRGSLDGWNSAYSIEILPQVEHCCQHLEKSLKNGEDITNIAAIAASMFLSAYHFASVHWCERFVNICEILLGKCTSANYDIGLMSDQGFLEAFVVERRGKISPQIGKSDEGIRVLSDFIANRPSIEGNPNATDPIDRLPNNLANSMHGCVYVLLAHQLIVTDRALEAITYLRSWQPLTPSSISERGVIRYRDRTLADAYVAQRNWSDAETILRALLAPDMPDAASFKGSMGEGWALQQLSEILHETDRSKEASALLLPAILAREDAKESERQDTIDLLLDLVACLLTEGAYDLVLANLLKLRQALEPQVGNKSSDTIMTQVTNMWCLTARLSCQLEDWEDAIVCWEKALEAARQVVWTNGYMIGAIRYSLAYALWKGKGEEQKLEELRYEVSIVDMETGRQLENVGIDAGWVKKMVEVKAELLKK